MVIRVVRCFSSGLVQEKEREWNTNIQYLQKTTKGFVSHTHLNILMYDNVKYE